MNNQDTKILIISFLDLNSLINMISVDKSTCNLLSQKICWDIIFKENNLPLCNMSYDDPSQWLVAFVKESKLKIYSNRLMDILEHPKREDFDNPYDFSDEAINKLRIDHRDLCFVNVLDVEEIDIREISKIYNIYVLDKLNPFLRARYLICDLLFSDNEYFVHLVYSFNSINGAYQYCVSRDSMKKILYNALSYGVIPNINYNKIKLIV